MRHLYLVNYLRKKAAPILLAISFSLIGNAQIFGPESLNMPGTWDGFFNPPTEDALRNPLQSASGDITLITSGTQRYQTTIHCANSGGDVTPGTYNWLFTSGPDGGYFNNKWAGVTPVNLNTLQNYTFNSGADNNITVSDGKWYTVNFEDSGYTDTRAIFMETTGSPVGFSGVTQQSPNNSVTPGTVVSVDAELSAVRNAELRVFVRYSDNGFLTSSVNELITTDDITFSRFIPDFNVVGTIVEYYFFTTTVDATTITDQSEYDLVSIDILNNNGSNYSYTVADKQTTTSDGFWDEPATWTSGSVPSAVDHIEMNHNVTIRTDVNQTGDIVINNPQILTIEPGQSLTHSGSNFVNEGEVDIRSTSLTFGSIIHSTNTIISGNGEFAYSRFVNSSGNGNDLIAPPVTGESWSDFLSSESNSFDLFDDGNNSPTTYAFGPFDKAVGDYVNFTDATSAFLITGVGYRAATDSGNNLVFTGSIETGNVSNDIENSGPSFVEWNLVGNPYPSYINVFNFLNFEVASGVSNIDLLGPGLSAAIYGYDGDASNGWTIYNFATASPTTLIAPGQGFFVGADPTNAPLYDLTFSPDIRAIGNSDDFIPGMTPTLVNLELELSSSNANYITDFYFNSNASLGLDPGYDAAIFGNNAPAFAIFSELVQDNAGDAIAVQALGENDFENTTIALGVNANQGEQITFNISANTLPIGTKVYLDDSVASVTTELTAGDYSVTPSVALSGSGRFFLRFEGSALSNPDLVLDDVVIFTQHNDIVISGALLLDSTLRLYDLQGRLVRESLLQSNLSQQRISITDVAGGVYIVELTNSASSQTQKVILR